MAIRLSITAILSFGLITPLMGQSDPNALQAYFDSMTRVEPIEGAEALGPLGYSVGIGMLGTPGLSEVKYYGDDQKSIDYSNSSALARLFIGKGVVYPVNVGLQITSDQNQQYGALGAYIQYSLVEQTQLPSLALRGSYGKATGLINGYFENYEINAIASYNFTYAGFFLGAGFHDSRGQVTVFDRDLYRQSIDLTSQGNNIWTFVGTKISVYAPYVYIGLNYAQNNDIQQVTAKISTGF